MEANLLEKYNVKALTPTNHSSAVNGPRVSMVNAERVTILVLIGSASSATANVLSLKQHNAASSGTTKALAVANTYYTKINTETEFTAVPVETDTDAYNLHADIGDNVAAVAFEVLAEDLDRENNFNWISVDLGAAGVARYSSIAYIVDSAYKPAYAGTL